MFAGAELGTLLFHYVVLRKNIMKSPINLITFYVHCAQTFLDCQ